MSPGAARRGLHSIGLRGQAALRADCAGRAPAFRREAEKFLGRGALFRPNMEPGSPKKTYLCHNGTDEV